MTLVQFYYDPIIEFDHLLGGVPAGRSSPRASCAPSSHQDVYRPRLDLHESKDTNTMTATFELPGLTPDDITVDVHQNRLIVSGEPAAHDPEEKRNYLIRERRFGKISRTLRLPFGTKPEDVKAKMENGILAITFPKTNPKQEIQCITVQ